MIRTVKQKTKFFMNGEEISHLMTNFVLILAYRIMKDLSKITFVLLLIGFIIGIANADKGVFGRKRNKVQLNITTISTLKKSIPFNLKSGLIFKGSSLLNSQQIGNSLFNTTLISYEKGNTIYILPYKQKILIPSYSRESGYKLIIRRK